MGLVLVALLPAKFACLHFVFTDCKKLKIVRHGLFSLARHSYSVPCISPDRLNLIWGHAVARSVEELRYKPGSCGFDSR